MRQYLDEVQVMRDRLLTRSLYAISVLGFFALMASLSRAIHVGWHNIMYLHIGFYVAILSTALLSQRISFHLRSLIILGTALGLGTAGLLSWGLVAFGIPALVTFSILATLLFGTRAGVISIILSIAILGAIGIGVQMGTVTFRFDPETYLMFFPSWLNAIFGMIMSAGVIVVALGTLNGQLVHLIQTLEKRNIELLNTNKRLETEIMERKREEEKQRVEARLQRAEKMEALGTLAGGVAHDLNNVLTGVVSYPYLLLKKLPEDSPLRNSVMKIQESGKKAAAIVQDLLTLARRGVPVTEIVNLNIVISEYLKSPEHEKLKSYHPGIEIETNLGEDLLNTIGSPIHFSKTVMNLVSNAVEAMPDGGKLSITTENRHIKKRIKGYDEIEKGDYVTLTVTDTGIGISSEDMEKIFEPFYTKKKMGRSGTGLGMAVVWGTIKDHKGHIDVQSTEGEGTTFTLYFPATSQKLTQDTHPSFTEEYMGKGESILVVDDVKEQRELAFSILSELGYSVTTASNGEEAFEYVWNNKVDLLLLDMIMDPGIDGLDTYRHIHELRPHQKAIIMSGFSETERVKEAQRLGAGAYLRKPYLSEEIGRAVRAELDN